MPTKYLTIRLFPEDTTDGGTFTSMISNLSIEVFQVSISDPTGENAVTIGTATSSDIEQFSSNRAAATGVVEVTFDEETEYDRPDLRLVVRDDGEVIIDEIIGYNMPLRDTRPIPYKRARPHCYVFLPLDQSAFSDLLNDDGTPSSYDKLYKALLSETTDAEGVLVKEGRSTDFVANPISRKEAEYCAKELVNAGQKNLPSLPEKRYQKLYTGKVIDDDNEDGDEDIIKDKFLEARNQWLSKLERNEAELKRKADQLTQYIWAFFGALWASQKTAEVTNMVFRFPKVPANFGRLECKINGITPGALTIDAPYFYALFAEMPLAISWEAGYQQFIKTEAKVLLTRLAEANEKGIIEFAFFEGNDQDIPERLPENAYQVLRKARALDNGGATGFTYTIQDVDNDPIDASINNLINSWASRNEINLEVVLDGNDENIAFWASLDTDATTGHKSLVAYVLAQTNEEIFNQLQANFTAAEVMQQASRSDWEGVFNAAVLDDIQAENVTFLPGQTPAEKAQFFANYVLDFFGQQNQSESADLGSITPQTSPAFEWPQDDLIQQALTALADTEFTITAIEEHLSNQPLNACQQDALRNKLTIIGELLALTNGVADVAIRQSAMEALYALGFTSRTQVGALTEAEFEQCVQGTIIADLVVDVDLTNLINTGNSTCDLSEKEALHAIIWCNGLSDKKFPDIMPGPVNDGTLVDCHYPADLNKLGRYHYLQTLLEFPVGQQSVNDYFQENWGLHIDQLLVTEANAQVPVDVAALNVQALESMLCEEDVFPCLYTASLENMRTYVEALSSDSIANIVPKITALNEQLNEWDKGDTVFGQALKNFQAVVVQQKNSGFVTQLGDILSAISDAQEENTSIFYGLAIEKLETLEKPMAQSFAKLLRVMEQSSPSELAQYAIDLDALLSSLAEANPIVNPLIAFVNDPLGPGSSSSETGGLLGNTANMPSPLTALACAYERFTGWVGACTAPYHALADIQQTYLGELGTNRYELGRKWNSKVHSFAPNPTLVPEGFATKALRYPVTLASAADYLNIPQTTYELFFAQPFSPANVRIPRWSSEGMQLDKALEILCLDCCTLSTLANNPWLKLVVQKTEDNGVVPLTSCTDCELHLYKLDFKTSTEEKPLYFWRLYLLAKLFNLAQDHLQCINDISDLLAIAQAANWFPHNDGSIDPHFILQLVSLDQMCSVFGVCIHWENDANEHLSLTSLLNRSDEHYAAAVEHFVDRLVTCCELELAEEDCCPPTFRKLLSEHIIVLAELFGFCEDSDAVLRWDAQFTNIIRFAEQLQRLCSSNFTMGQLEYMFTSNAQRLGDDPLPQQTANEAREHPFDLADNDPDFNLAALREKLLAVTVDDEEADAFSWLDLDVFVRTELGYEATGNDDILLQFGKFFFGDHLSNVGYTVTTADRQFRASLPASTTALGVWNSGDPSAPFRYDSATEELFVQLPLSAAAVETKLQSIRQLNSSEQAAVRNCWFGPQVWLNTFLGFFDDFTTTRQLLLETPVEAERWKIFAQGVMLYRKRSQIIATHLTEQLRPHFPTLTLDERLTAKVLAKLPAFDNPVDAPWENDNGDLPAHQWTLPWQAGALTALQGLIGTGLLTEYFRLDKPTVRLFREVRSELASNNIDSNPLAGIISTQNDTISTPGHLQVRNGYVFAGPNTEALGNAYGYRVKLSGILYVTESGKYSFRAGAPTPGGEVPDFTQAEAARWQLTLQRGNKTYLVLDNDWEQDDTPADCSVPMSLKAGAYDICFWYEHPAPNWSAIENICPTIPGWVIKWQRPGNDHWEVIGQKHLYHDCAYGDLAEGVSNAPSSSQLGRALSNEYHPGIAGIRATYIQSIAASTLLHGFELDAEPLSDRGLSEVDYYLAHPQQFMGTSFYGSDFTPHNVPLSLSALPVLDNYCPMDMADDQRSTPSKQRTQAWSAIWERLWEAWNWKQTAKKESYDRVWLIMHECQENHLAGAAALHTERYLGIPAKCYPVVAQFADQDLLTCGNLLNERWPIRIWEAYQCLLAWQCKRSGLSLVDLEPAKWLPITFDEAGDQASQKLQTAIHNALMVYPTDVNTAIANLQRPIWQRRWDVISSVVNSDSEINIEAILPAVSGGCRQLTRLDYAITLVQRYVNGVRSGISVDSRQGRLTDNQRTQWEHQLMTYEQWRACQHQVCYPEDYSEHLILAEDRKSEGFRFFESQLKQQVLTTPMNGVGVATKPSLGHLLPLQARQKSVVNVGGGNQRTLVPGENHVVGSHYGRPALPTQADWKNGSVGSLDFWLETVRRAGQQPIRVPAAGAAPGQMYLDCKPAPCCPDGHNEQHYPPTEYLFWLVDAVGYKDFRTACEHIKEAQNTTAEDQGKSLPELMFLHEKPLIYLAWVKIERGRVQQVCWSTESLCVDTDSAELVFGGRFQDSLFLQITGASSCIEQGENFPNINFTDPEHIGFRFDLVTEEAIVLPSLEHVLPEAEYRFHFVRYDAGAPVLPKQPHGISLLIAAQLQLHCQYAAAKDWLDWSLPVPEASAWWLYDDEGKLQLNASEGRRKTLLFAQLENLHKWVQYLHRKNTAESLQQAEQLLLLANQVMGTRPRTTSAGWPEESICLRDFKAVLPPLNPRLLCYYDTFADLSAMLQACITNSRSHCGMQSPIGQGMNPGGLACSVDAYCLPQSPYRFQGLLGKAKECVGQLSSLGDALLAAFEKRENETLSFIRESQGRQIQVQSWEMKANLVREAKFNVDAAEKALEIAILRLTHYISLISVGLIPEEEDNLSLQENLLVLRSISQGIQAAAQPWHTSPDTNSGTVTFFTLPTGSKVAQTIEAGGRVVGILADINSGRANLKSINANYLRRAQEWQHQVDVLTKEVKQLEIQLLAAKRLLSNTEKDLELHRLQMDHSNNTLQFLKQKFTGEEFYHWQSRELAQLYHQMYECCLQLVYQTQLACNIEQGYTKDNWLEQPVWDNFQQGLLAGRRLQFALSKMEQAYMNQNTRRYELSTALSLRQHQPLAYLELLYTGKTVMEIPEALAAKDYPGHYCRMIKSVSLSIPAVIGPYGSVNCTLGVLGSRVRISPRLNASPENCNTTDVASAYSIQENDDRFVLLPASDDALATSRGLSDSGLFEMRFQDERKHRFECHGLTAQFCIQMPIEDNAFDFRSISDLILEVNYTAKEGGALLAEAARAAHASYLPGNGHQLLCLKDDRPDDWYEYQQNEQQRFALHLDRKTFPYIIGSHKLFVDRIELFIETVSCPPCDGFEVYFQEPLDSGCIDCDDTLIQCVKLPEMGDLFYGVLNHHFDIMDERTLAGHFQFPIDQEIKRVYLLLGYGKENATCAEAENRGCKC